MTTFVLALALALFALPGCSGNKKVKEESEQIAAQNNQLTDAQITVQIATDPLADPDARREALIAIATSSAAAEPVYLDLYRATLADPTLDATVAAVAAAALGNHGQPEDTGRLTPLLTRDATFLRWQAAVSLQRLHNPQAIAPLIGAATKDEDPDVRMACATALGQYPRRDVFDALTTVLDDRDYGVSRAAQESLTLMAQHDAGDDPRDWRDFADANSATLFQEPGPYTYTPYPPRRGIVSNILLFWLKPVAQPQYPIGYEPPTDETADAG
ncbi:HEAT repeat domain-containing protein [Algisphaera agarilytica]|uniref:HEAT repeat domain-containing protein n=1 Tax=Algisphaera agarilytica TaxID=1385975 RepID=UPI001C880AED|nr:HEAT repeat domain-containing protein [Algisphaera agarilytica]